MEDLGALGSQKGNHFDCCPVTRKDTDTGGIALEYPFPKTQGFSGRQSGCSFSAGT